MNDAMRWSAWSSALTWAEALTDWPWQEHPGYSPQQTVRGSCATSWPRQCCCVAMLCKPPQGWTGSGSPRLPISSSCGSQRWPSSLITPALCVGCWLTIGAPSNRLATSPAVTILSLRCTPASGPRNGADWSTGAAAVLAAHRCDATSATDADKDLQFGARVDFIIGRYHQRYLDKLRKLFGTN
jgi:hypothetical protein